MEVIIGAKYGFLTVQDVVLEDDKRTRVEVKCDCGNVVTRSFWSVKYGYVHNCGCEKIESRLRRSLKDKLKAYSLGDCIKIHLSARATNFNCTFGVVTSISDPKRPVVAYKDLSELPLAKFNRIVVKKEVSIDGEFKTHRVLPIA